MQKNEGEINYEVARSEASEPISTTHGIRFTHIYVLLRASRTYPNNNGGNKTQRAMKKLKRQEKSANGQQERCELPCYSTDKMSCCLEPP